MDGEVLLCRRYFSVNWLPLLLVILYYYLYYFYNKYNILLLLQAAVPLGETVSSRLWRFNYGGWRMCCIHLSIRSILSMQYIPIARPSHKRGRSGAGGVRCTCIARPHPPQERADGRGSCTPNVIIIIYTIFEDGSIACEASP